MHQLKYIFLVLTAVNNLYGQGVADTIRKIAIAWEDRASVNPRLYEALKDYGCICIGEMHGTKEPAEFLTALARTFSANHKKVLIGFEIPEVEMRAFINQKDSTGLSGAAFFKTEGCCGMNSEAWYKAIGAFARLGARFCFFDESVDDRDYSMYKKLIACYEKDSDAVILTLSGNIHNKLLPYKGVRTMGCYLKEYFKGRVYAINHLYNEGTMYNKTSDGLRIRTIEPVNNVFATSTGYDAYFIPNIFNDTDGYSGYLYTRRVTASLFPKTAK